MSFSILFIATFCILFSCNNASEKTVVKTEVVTPEKFSLPKLPSSVHFCGEVILIDDFDVQERLDRELVINTYFHSSTIQYFKRANRYFDFLSSILKEEGVPDDMKYLCLIESGLAQATSKSGAKGFWQFMPVTAKEYGLKVNAEIDERLNIEKSTRAACQFLKDAYQKFGDWSLTAASYNRGMGGIKNDLESQFVEDYNDLYLNTETSRYVFRILALKLIFESPSEYGFDLESMQLYQPVKTKKITIEKSISDLKKWAIEKGSNYKMLRLLNPWILTNKLSISGSAFTIELPLNE